MLFNSFIYIAVFLPLVLLGYFFLGNRNVRYAKIFLLASSLFFYAYWSPVYVLLIIGSIVINFSIGRNLSIYKSGKIRHILFVVGIIFNVGLLAYFKYANFILQNLNYIGIGQFENVDIILPLAISFFTFQQIAYLSDSYKRLTSDYDIFHYALFVSFFPQLIAGPIVHHSEMMPQFNNRANGVVNYKNIAAGTYMFFMGLFKKIVLADSFAHIANFGYDQVSNLTFFEGWLTSFAYAFQLYFDFSGYSDMAIGGALLFNIVLPWNFNSPYHATSIQDFWRRWHITLSRFLRDYVYIPLGGNKGKLSSIIRNLILTFLIGGIWHGAGWTFVIWGLLHGLAVSIHHLWKKTGFEIPNFLAIILTFTFVNFAWVFFRAPNFDSAILLISHMVSFDGIWAIHDGLIDKLALPVYFLGVILLFLRNTNYRLTSFQLDFKHLLVTFVLIVICILQLNSADSAEFLYYDF